jgi:hypothetical protein
MLPREVDSACQVRRVKNSRFRGWLYYCRDEARSTGATLGVFMGLHLLVDAIRSTGLPSVRRNA